MSPSTHSADVSQIQTDTAAILVDTGTTIPATIDTVDTVVDAVLVDTGTTLPATLSGLRDNAVKFASGDLNASNSSSAALADTGMTITVPDVAGKTYTVVLYGPGTSIADATNSLAFAWDGDTQGGSTQYAIGTATEAGVYNLGHQMAWGGFVAGEVVKVQWVTNANTKYVYLYGPWAMMAYEEA